MVALSLLFFRSMKTKILYLEDEPFLGKIVMETLEHRGFEVRLEKDGRKLKEVVKSFHPDICVLDVMLPYIDGFSLGKEIRSLYPRLPILFLTAKSQTEDVVKGFESGGTDYLRKPFSMEELVARINNQLQLLFAGRENEKKNLEEIRLGKFRFLPGKYELHTSSEVIRLSNRESEVLSLLANHANQTLDRKKILVSVWGDDSFFNSRTLDVYIRKLRDYLSLEEGLQIITLKGKGYHFVVPDK
jgi:DNA-binding response OmpR family regulator